MSVLGWIFQLVPFVLMGILVLFILRQSRRGTNQSFVGRGVVVIDLADQIKKLDDLRQTGVLTDDEFQAAKARLLR